MNQILATENNREKNKKTSNQTPMDVKSIVRFFAIVILVFGVLLIISAAYSMIKNKNTQEANNQSNSIPTVNITQEGSNVVISIQHDKPIDKIIYSWNKGEETTLQGMGRTRVEEYIILPLGDNTLYVEISDNTGKKVKYEKQFSLQEGQDVIAPTIELTDDGEGNIKIVAKDDIAMSYITYSWNDGEETRVDVHPDSPKQIQEKIKSLEGLNKLKIVAVDTSENKEEKEQQVYAGAPKISVMQEGINLKIHIEDQVEITKVSYILNGRGYESGDLNQTVVDFEQELDEGENIFTMVVTNRFGKEARFEGKCTR